MVWHGKVWCGADQAKKQAPHLKTGSPLSAQHKCMFCMYLLRKPGPGIECISENFIIIFQAIYSTGLALMLVWKMAMTSIQAHNLAVREALIWHSTFLDPLLKVLFGLSSGFQYTLIVLSDVAAYSKLAPPLVGQQGAHVIHLHRAFSNALIIILEFYGFRFLCFSMVTR